MILRIVRMDFDPNRVAAFTALFHSVKDQIAAHPGCLHLKLCKDAKKDHVYYTVSKWSSEAALNAYRSSAFFAEVWAKTKPLFQNKPHAYSLVET